ncbi:AdoMet-dependent rRNA methyltransferase SPB1 [Zancudomyces culisetae]|uniref:AdoMet-dependent rRNA methyltransferase SPB1 n=1 Tax=Zancudomyces culisetae TaxID=1213189 RepID=A0A1R1PR35_ZANCU|nr:AdoMet-dependent rRNA methyltransferase SPB1 [Zancudomyces culisetae]|eukprot:OMH83446.1 AdoMet-dependent rRNA methyltransferase SPB1 [Zancudomyces culisetae]
MGFKKKTGKGRLDKYYHLAKEQGYRARSAFKLIQLNKKYNFLGSARALIDLCAAPGGWLQVAQKYMPSSSVIVGVDLVPIKPIPKVITLVEDITTDKCRNSLSQTLKTWKADVVLHDGAPNVGAAWEHDAFTQAELVLKSLSLATEFLKKGGVFVTKVFRSRDYNSLLWVFNQLFEKVEATKPPSSRNVSAEIFVVCQGFKAPKKIDSKFLDSRYVFEELDLTGKQNNVEDIFAPEKKQKKRHREGYEEGLNVLFKKQRAMDFINSKEPAVVLATNNVLEFVETEDKELAKYPETDQDILLACADLKVLGKKDFRKLMKWRASIRERLQLDAKQQQQQQADKKEGEGEEELESADELELVAEADKKRLRKERRKVNERRKKQLVKLQLNMTTPADIGMDQGDESLFTIPSSGVKSKAKTIRKVVGQIDIDDANELDPDSDIEEEFGYSHSEDEGSDFDSGDDIAKSGHDRKRALMMNRELDRQYSQYLEKSSTKTRPENNDKKEFRGFDSDLESIESYGDMDKDTYRDKALAEDDTGSESDSDDDMSTKRKRPGQSRSGASPDSDDEEAISEMKRSLKKQKVEDSESIQLSKQAALWFDQPLFKDIPIAPDSIELDDTQSTTSAPSSTTVSSKAEANTNTKTKSKDKTKTKTKAKAKAKANDKVKVTNEDVPTVLPSKKTQQKKNAEPEEEALEDDDDDLDYSILNTPEALTLAHDLLNGNITKEKLIDNYYNRYAHNDIQDLPSWYLDNERKFNKPVIPISEDAMKSLKASSEKINSRPIKKVMEAKARKKNKFLKKLEKLKAKANDMNESTDMTEAEKAKSIQSMMRKGIASANAKSRKNKAKVVVAKGSNKRVKGRPKGVKGKYKMVDSRLRKDLRNQKSKSKNKRRK